MSWRTVVITGCAKLDYKMDYLVVRKASGTSKVHLSEIGVLLIESTAVSLTAMLLCELIKHKTKVVFCDEKHNPHSELLSCYGSHDTSSKLRQQILWSQTIKDAVWTEIVREKIRNQMKHLYIKGEKDAAELLHQYIRQIEPEDATNREGHAAIEMSKVFAMVSSPLEITFDKREIQKKLFSILSGELQMSSNADKLAGIYSELLSVLEDLFASSSYDVSFDFELEYAELFKFFDVNISQPEGRFTERFVSYAETLHRLTGRSVFVLANCDPYISDEDYLLLSKWALYEGISLVMLRDRQRSLNNEENEYIIDMDLCELH